MGNTAQKILVLSFCITLALGGLVLILNREYRLPLIIASNSTYYPGVSDEMIKKYAVRVSRQRGSSSGRLRTRSAVRETALREKSVPTTPRQKVNINLASKETLESSLGIAPDMADKIIFYRRIHKSFKEKSELLKIPGVTREMYETISPFVEAP